MTGENFIRLNRKRDTRLEDALQDAKIAFTDYSKQSPYDENWSFDKLWKLEKKVERLEYLVYCKNYNA